MHTLHQNPHVRLQRVQWAAATVRSHNAIRILLPVHQGCQKNSTSPLPILGWQGTMRESFWMMVPKEAQCSQGAIDCQHDRLLVSYAKEEGKGGIPWASLSCCCSHSLQQGAGKPGPSDGCCLGMIRKQCMESYCCPQKCICSPGLSQARYPGSEISLSFVLIWERIAEWQVWFLSLCVC